jgi:hypothetical protein
MVQEGLAIEPIVLAGVLPLTILAVDHELGKLPSQLALGHGY